jgi:2-polyprenyl-6-methoxyphenol hydroxylase-like FAD-dependent oxidoreductase
MADSWTDDPTAPGTVLIGDAAGWSDPVIGQGLGVAFRDARVLTDVLLSGARWDGTALREYVEERRERMRRLRFVVALASVLGGLGVQDRRERCTRMQARLAESPKLAMALGAGFAGPWNVPAQAFEPSALATLALA